MSSSRRQNRHRTFGHGAWINSPEYNNDSVRMQRRLRRMSKAARKAAQSLRKLGKAFASIRITVKELQ